MAVHITVISDSKPLLLCTHSFNAVTENYNFGISSDVKHFNSLLPDWVQHVKQSPNFFPANKAH